MLVNETITSQLKTIESSITIRTQVYSQFGTMHSKYNKYKQELGTDLLFLFLLTHWQIAHDASAHGGMSANGLSDYLVFF